MKRNAFVNIILLSLFALLSSCASTVERAPTESKTPRRHIIFLIHGIGGKIENFGSMDKALLANLPTYDTQTQFEVASFSYETGTATQDTYLFAKKFGKYMDDYFKTRPLKEEDKISLVMHSQGGLVGLIWLFKAFANVDPDYYPQYTRYIDSFLTLGTPFWGAKIATFATGMGKATAPLLRLLRLGDVELREMNLGSETTRNFRKGVTSPDFQEVVNKIRTQVRTLNVGGVFSELKALGVFVSGESEYEDDTAVPIPSSRFNFINGDTEMSFAPFLIANAIHLSPLPSKIKSLTDVQKKCIENIDCNHPTFKIVLNHLLNLPMDEKIIQKSESNLKKMTSFLVDININLAKDKILKSSDVKITFKKPSGVKISEPLELYSRGESRVVSEKTNLRYYYFGNSLNKYIKPEERQNRIEFKDAYVDIEVSAPGYESKSIRIKVRPTYSTYVEVNLEEK